jgi:PhnB protein
MKEKNVSQSTLVNPIPEGFSTLTPFLVVEGAAKFLEFVKKAFDAKITIAMKNPEGQIMHATAKIGDSQIMVADAMQGMKAMPCMLYLYVEEIDATYKQALKAGGKSLREPVDEFYGDRSAAITDEWNNQWWVATHIEDVDEDEIKRRAEKLSKKQS